MKKVKCPTCLQTKSDKVFVEIVRGEKKVYESCSDCRQKFRETRKREIQRVILLEATKLGLLKPR